TGAERPAQRGDRPLRPYGGRDGRGGTGRSGTSAAGGSWRRGAHGGRPGGFAAEAGSDVTHTREVRYPSNRQRVSDDTAGCPSGQRERSVKPSAQPTQVQILDLPPAGEEASDQQKCGSEASSFHDP